MKNYNVVWVSPVPRPATQGRDRQMFSTIDPKTGELTNHSKPMNKTRETGTGYRMGFMPDTSKNKFNTGLEESVDNPFYNLDPADVISDFGLNHLWSSEIEKIVKQPKLKKQTLFEILDKQAPGFYKSEMTGGNLFQYSKNMPKIEASFIERFYIVLYDGSNRFTDETPRGRLAIQLLRNHNKIAQDKKSINSALHNFYISEENEAEMEKMRKQDVIDMATFAKIKLFTEASEYKAYQVAVMCLNSQGVPIIKGVASKDNVKQAINRYLESGTQQMVNVDKFITITDLLKDPTNRLRFDILYLTQQAINTNVLSMRDGYLIWHSKSETPLYKFSDRDKFVSFMQTELIKYNPDDLEVTNYYHDLVEELKKKNVWVE